MSSLQKIKKNKRNKCIANKYIKNNYKSPPPINIIINYLKEQNIDLITRFIIENNYDKKYIDILINKFILIGNYTPEIVQKKNKERLQCINIIK